MNILNLNKILLANPNAPTNDDYARDLARKLFPPKDQRVEKVLELSLYEGVTRLAASDDESNEWCGEYTWGLLEAVLASSLISANAKADIRAIMSDATPALEKEKTIGHFHFKWTETSGDARDNVTEAAIDATGTVLNDMWDRYAADFRQPKALLVGGRRIIYVEVYFSSGLYGSTSSHSNTIFLNSRDVVMDECRRGTTSAHELFHRVQYAYGYVTGTGGQTWWVEAIASWSQEYAYGDINDYVGRINGGLDSPDRSVLNRSYDGCHYWTYFAEQLVKRSAEVNSEQQAIREFLRTYSTNGLNAKAASETTTQTRIGRTFDGFFEDWSKANFIKDLDNPSTRYEYDEDELVTTRCGRTFGPYRHVAAVISQAIASDTFSWTSPTYSVNAYGSDYLDFTINPVVTKISIRFEGNPTGGAGVFSTHLIMIKSNRWKSIYNNSAVSERTWNLSFSAGDYDRCILVVNGLATGGQYEVSVNACMSGVWRDSYNYVWTLVQSGRDVNGTVATNTCGKYSVTGTFDGKNITLNALGSCCDFKYQGTIEDCQSGSGTWTNDCGGKGSWSMNRTDAEEAMRMLASEEEELADNPATMR